MPKRSSDLIIRSMDLSIVIPALNESKKIVRDIEMAAMFLEGNNSKGEIIVVDDGSTDDTSARRQKVLKCLRCVMLKVIRYQQHRGKGYAVRDGY